MPRFHNVSVGPSEVSELAVKDWHALGMDVPGTALACQAFDRTRALYYDLPPAVQKTVTMDYSGGTLDEAPLSVNAAKIATYLRSHPRNLRGDLYRVFYLREHPQPKDPFSPQRTNTERRMHEGPIVSLLAGRPQRLVAAIGVSMSSRQPRQAHRKEGDYTIGFWCDATELVLDRLENIASHIQRMREHGGPIELDGVADDEITGAITGTLGTISEYEGAELVAGCGNKRLTISWAPAGSASLRIASKNTAQRLHGSAIGLRSPRRTLYTSA